MSLDFLAVASDVEQQEERDVVGGYKAFTADLYAAVIKVAYLDKSAGGANNVTIEFEVGDDNRKYTHTEYITNKQGNNFYVDKKDNKTKRTMPGMAKMSTLAELITGKPLVNNTFENKLINVYDPALKQDVKQHRKVLVDWVGAKLYLGINCTLENKNVKSGDIYVPTAETREVNDINKFFDENKATLLEKIAGTPPKFFEEWLTANKDKVINKVVPVTGGPQAGAPSLGAAAAPIVFTED